jgi:hypothetical protein
MSTGDKTAEERAVTYCNATYGNRDAMLTDSLIDQWMAAYDAYVAATLWTENEQYKEYRKDVVSLKKENEELKKEIETLSKFDER